MRGLIMSLPSPINWMQKPSEPKNLFLWKWATTGSSQTNMPSQKSDLFFEAENWQEARNTIEFWIMGLNQGIEPLVWDDFGSGRNYTQLIYQEEDLAVAQEKNTITGFIGSLRCINELVVSEEEIGPLMRGKDPLTPEEEEWYLSQVSDTTLS